MIRTVVFLSVLLTIGLGSAHAKDQENAYVGKSSCAGELRGTGRYGMRLDKSQNAFLSARTLDGKKVLMIIQYAKDGDSCGVVRDAIESHNAHASFEFVCADCTNPSSVVVGTWPDDNNSASSKAVEAWQIDLQELKFSPITQEVKCVRRTFHDADAGEDLVTWGRKGISKNCLSSKKGSDRSAKRQ